MPRLAVTDRAYRYRANRVSPHGKKRCAFCGSTRNVVPDHIDGHEENAAPDNLMWLCKSCNTAKGVAMRNAGLGRPTRQFNDALRNGGKPASVASRGNSFNGAAARSNPTKSGGAATIGEWMRAVGSIIPHKGVKYSGENYGLVAAMPVHEAVRMIRATPAHRRSEFASKLRHNPGAFERCVKSVTKTGSADDPRAVCAVAGRRKYGRAEMTRRAVAGKKRAARKRNPADSSAEAYERFHGRKPTQYVKVTKRIHHHANLWSIGDLRKLKIKSVDGRSIVSLSSFKGTILAANEQAFSDLTQQGRARLTQLFIEGGDQSVSLRDFGIDPNDAHELETLGKATLIDYKTVKVHLGAEGGDAVYRHKFRTTREGDAHVTLRVARYPDVIYRVLDKQLEFSGGSYEIRAEGIDR